MANGQLLDLLVEINNGRLLIWSYLQVFILFVPLLLFFGINSRQLKRWWKRDKQRHDYLKGLVKKSFAAADTNERRQARGELTKKAVAMSITLALAAIAWFALEAFIERVNQESVASSQESLAHWDTMTQRLNRRATPLEKWVIALPDIGDSSNGSKEEEIRRLLEGIRDESRQDVKAFRDRSLCTLKFERYLFEKRYEGYDEFWVLFLAINRFDACMLENGWHIETCSKTDSEENCKELPYVEPECVERLRQWLISDRSKWSSSPCPGYTWNWKRDYEDGQRP